jgi:hypothetical protein
MKVIAKHFHPMRGHVEDGTVVLFANGSELTIKSGMRGWRLVDGSGADAAPESSSAHELTAQIVQMDAA